MTTTLKLKEFDCPTNSPTLTTRVAYVLLPGNRCVFGGIVPSVTTICVAEKVIDWIAKHERLDRFACRFYDIQMHVQHGGRDCPHPGEFEFDELMIKSYPRSPEGIHVEGWSCVPCPPEVIEIFRQHIGDTSRPPYQYSYTRGHDTSRPPRDWD